VFVVIVVVYFVIDLILKLSDTPPYRGHDPLPSYPSPIILATTYQFLVSLVGPPIF